MKGIITNLVSFAFGAVIGAAAGASFITFCELTMPELRQMSEEMSKYYDQI